MYIWNDSKDLLSEASNIILRLFGCRVKYRDFGTYGRVDLGSRPAQVFLSKIVGIPTGKKKEKIRIPKFVFLNKSFKVAFLQGLFDTDGGVTFHKNRKSILFSSSNKDFLLEVQKMLNDFGIMIRGPYLQDNKKGFELRTFKKSTINRFIKKIGCLHPLKKKRLCASVA